MSIEVIKLGHYLGGDNDHIISFFATLIAVMKWRRLVCYELDIMKTIFLTLFSQYPVQLCQKLNFKLNFVLVQILSVYFEYLIDV